MLKKNKLKIMNRITDILKVVFIMFTLYSCKDNKETNKSIIIIDCSHISNNLGDVYGLILKHDVIYSCIKTNTQDGSTFNYSFDEREFNDFDNFVDDLTMLAGKYDQSKNRNVVDGANYVLIIKNDSIEKKYHFNSILMTDNLFNKIEEIENYYKFSKFKPINKFDFPTNEMCIDTIPEPKFL